MKNTSILTLSSVALLVLASCSKQESEPQSAEVAPYPLDVCLVSGKALGSMGEPHVVEHAGQQIKFCCDACLPEFEEDPDAFVQRIEEAARENTPAS